MTYLFQNATAFDPYTGQGVPNASGQVFAMSDTGFVAPLAVTTLSSGLQTTELVSDQYSQLPGFDAGDNVQVRFRSGEFTKVLNTSTPLVGQQGDAGKSAYQVAIEGGYAGTEAEYNATLINAPNLVTRAETAETAAVNAANLVGAPADTAIATAINGPGTQTRTALSAEFVQRGSNLVSAGVGATEALPDDYDVGATGTVVAIGRDAMKNMLGAKKSIAIGTGAQAEGLYTRDNIAIGEDALNRVSAASADYVSDTSGTRNVAVGGNAGRFTKQGVAHVMVGRNAGQNMVGGTGLVAIGNGAHASRCPVGISGEIEMWAPANPGGTNAYNVTAVGAWSASRNTAGDCTAIGSYALAGNTQSNANVALGSNALRRVDESTWLDGTTYITKGVTGTYVHTGLTLTLNFVGHAAIVGDILDFQLTSGESQSFGKDAVFARVVTVVNANTVTVAHSKSITASGSALLIGVSKQGTTPARSNNNTAVGSAALAYLDGGGANVAVGKSAGLNIKTGDYNVLIGSEVATGAVGAASSDNTAVGYRALFAVSGAVGNTVMGRQAGETITTGNVNTFIGYKAGAGAPSNITDAVAVGAYASPLHDYTVVLGRSSASTAANQVAIGARHLEIRNSAQPTVPTGGARIWYESSTGQLKAILPSGTITTLAT